MSKNVVNWFEIPVADMSRAKKFYGGVFQKEMMDLPMEQGEMAAFPWTEGGEFAAGALVKHEQTNPGGNGTVVYFHCEDVSTEAGRVEDHGGKVVQPKMGIGEHGFIALGMDTEGNMFGMHSMN